MPIKTRDIVTIRTIYKGLIYTKITKHGRVGFQKASPTDMAHSTNY